ncbi:MurR/RpiR family transcriptional regulator [Vibrio algivorus]|uniref:RpiR family transcriptional regulator n=1 Tax=Vibrio algivorus TaxID=1667024 RepID=A0ABQ6EL37_9VIBR|nr:MurR/RpiR family transcriptional regulator [Vibrio algivorus]GLT13795.1 rpiR family transcriptional regulator [Vibrio algivorus]
MERYINLKLKIQEAYGDFSSGHTKVADYIQSNPEQLLIQSTNEIAQYCEVSKATVSRFVRKLGYENHQELRNELLNVREQGVPMIIQSEISNILQADIAALYKLNEQLEELDITNIVEGIAKARKVVIVGYRNNYPVALHFRQQLLQCRNNVIVVPVAGQTVSEELVDITEDDFIILFGIRRRTKSFNSLLSYLKPYNHLLISDQSGQKYAQQCRYFLLCPMNTQEPLDSYSTPMAIVSFLSNHIYRYLGQQANTQSVLVSNLYRELDELE